MCFFLLLWPTPENFHNFWKFWPVNCTPRIICYNLKKYRKSIGQAYLEIQRSNKQNQTIKKKHIYF
jgi:hypothetical protein